MVLRSSVRLNIYKGVYNLTISVSIKKHRCKNDAKKGTENEIKLYVF